MDKKEFGLFASALKTYFPKEDKLLPNAQSMELWFRELQDIPFPVAEAALRKWVSTQKWSPSIAEIRELAATISSGEIPDWGEGWRQVCEAMRIYGREYPKSALKSMDAITAEAVQQLGSWWNLCVSENQDTIRANFRMVYESIAKRKKKEQQLSLDLRSDIAMLQNNTDGRHLLPGDIERN